MVVFKMPRNKYDWAEPIHENSNMIHQELVLNLIWNDHTYRFVTENGEPWNKSPSIALSPCSDHVPMDLHAGQQDHLQNTAPNCFISNHNHKH